MVVIEEQTISRIYHQTTQDFQKKAKKKKKVKKEKAIKEEKTQRARGEKTIRLKMTNRHKTSVEDTYRTLLVNYISRTLFG